MNNQRRKSCLLVLHNRIMISHSFDKETGIMAQRKLSDSELAANVRQRNRQASERRRERLAIAGKVQLLTWIPDTLRRELDGVAAARGERLSETTTALLLAGLNATGTPATPPQPVYTGGGDRDALMAEVGKLLNEGHTGAEIARQLNASGKRTATGSAFTGGNLLRDYRRWQATKDAAE